MVKFDDEQYQPLTPEIDGPDTTGITSRMQQSDVVDDGAKYHAKPSDAANLKLSHQYAVQANTPNAPRPKFGRAALIRALDANTKALDEAIRLSCGFYSDKRVLTAIDGLRNTASALIKYEEPTHIEQETSVKASIDIHSISLKLVESLKTPDPLASLGEHGPQLMEGLRLMFAAHDAEEQRIQSLKPKALPAPVEILPPVGEIWTAVMASLPNAALPSRPALVPGTAGTSIAAIDASRASPPSPSAMNVVASSATSTAADLKE